MTRVPSLKNWVYIKMLKNHTPMNSSGGTITFLKDDVFFFPYEQARDFIENGLAEIS